jgi:PAS domain-containing protein
MGGAVSTRNNPSTKIPQKEYSVTTERIGFDSKESFDLTVDEKFYEFFMTGITTKRDKIETLLWKLLLNKIPAMEVYGPTFAEYHLSVSPHDIKSKSLYLTNLKTMDSNSFTRNRLIEKENILPNELIAFEDMRDFLLLILWDLYREDNKHLLFAARPVVESFVTDTDTIQSFPNSDKKETTQRKKKTVRKASLTVPESVLPTKCDNDRFKAIVQLFERFSFFASQKHDLKHFVNQGKWLHKRSLDLLLDNIMSPMVILSVEKNSFFPIIYCNNSFENLMQYSRSEVIGKTINTFFCSKTELESQNKLSYSFRFGIGLKVVITQEKKDGTIFYNFLSVLPIHRNSNVSTDNSNYSWILLTFYDITKSNANLRELHHCEELSYLIALILSGNRS